MFIVNIEGVSLLKNILGVFKVILKYSRKP